MNNLSATKEWKCVHMQLGSFRKKNSSNVASLQFTVNTVKLWPETRDKPRLQSLFINILGTVYPKKYAHGFCFAVLCCGYTLTDFPISIRLTSLALWQSNDCPSASKATLMSIDTYFMWIHYERLHNHNKAKHNKTVCIFLGIYCRLTHSMALLYYVTIKHTIISTNAAILLIGPLGTNISAILIEMYIFQFKKCTWKGRLQNGGHFVSASMLRLPDLMNLNRLLNMNKWRSANSFCFACELIQRSHNIRQVNDVCNVTQQTGLRKASCFHIVYCFSIWYLCLFEDNFYIYIPLWILIVLVWYTSMVLTSMVSLNMLTFVKETHQDGYCAIWNICVCRYMCIYDIATIMVGISWRTRNTFT